MQARAASRYSAWWSFEGLGHDRGEGIRLAHFPAGVYTSLMMLIPLRFRAWNIRTSLSSAIRLSALLRAGEVPATLRQPDELLLAIVE